MKTLHGLPPVTGSGTARRAATAIYLSRSRSQHAASLDVSFTWLAGPGLVGYRAYRPASRGNK